GDTLFFFSGRRRHTRSKRDWSSDVCSSDLRKAPRIQSSRLRPAVAHLQRPLPRPPVRRPSLPSRHWDSLLRRKSALRKLRRTKRSEERRVGKERRYRKSPCAEKM